LKEGKMLDLGMNGYDELFMTDKQRQENKLPKIREIPLDQIDDFPDHPFQVKMNEDMQELVESIKENGLITPVILRTKEDGRFEIVSGHRRKKACEIAGMHTIKAEIREMTRDEAIILMVDANLQRSEILPSEKAKAYKMRLEAMKRQGRRTDLTCDPVGHKFAGEKTVAVIADSSPDSKTQIQRYIRLNELIPELLELVDEGRIGMRPAVELSYLPKNEQQVLNDVIEYTDATPSHAQAIRLRAFSRDHLLGPNVIENVMNEEKPNQREKISFKFAEARKYIPAEVPYERTKEYIMKVLEDHYQRMKRRVERDDR